MSLYTQKSWPILRKARTRSAKESRRGAMRTTSKWGSKMTVRGSDKGGKLETDMLGPLQITELQGKSADLGGGFKINIDHLTHYVQPGERIPAKLMTFLDLSLAGPSQHPLKQHTHIFHSWGEIHKPKRSSFIGCRHV